MNNRLLQLILILLMPIVCSAQTYVSFEADGIKYSINEDPESKHAIVRGFTSKTVTIPEKIQYKGDDYIVYDYRYGIKSLSGFDNLESLISKIRIKADFSYHPNIKTVKMPFPLEFSFEHCDNLESVTFTSNENTNNVKLYQNSFSFCPKLKKVTFPSNMKVTEIEAAFYGCTSLKSFSIPLQIIRIGERAFYGCSSLTSINIHWDSVRYIGDGAFSGCKSLNIISIDVPNGVTYIGESAFEGCTKLSSVNIPNSVTQIGQRAFYGTGLTEITIPSSVEKFGGSIFANCLNLTSATIKCERIALGNYYTDSNGNIHNSDKGGIFEGSGLEEINFENSLVKIGDNIFKGCTNLKSVTIPSTVKEIGKFAFYRCTSLASVTIGGDDITINGGAFARCTSLTDVIFEEGNKIIPVDGGPNGSISEYNATTGEYESFTAYSIFDGCTNLKSLTVRGTINLNNNSFSCVSQGLFRQSSIPNIYISDVNAWLNSNIGFGGTGTRRYRLFLNGEELEHLKIPEGVTTINDAAFGGCASLKSVTIPNSVTSIGEHAFTNCDSLLLVMSEIENPFTFDLGYGQGILCYFSDENIGNSLLCWDTFCVYKKSLLTLYVPQFSVEKYKETKDWNQFPRIASYDPDSPFIDLDELYPAPFHNRPRVTITANSYTIKYGDELPEFGYTSSGTTLYGEPEITCEATQTSPVGTYPIVVSKGSVTNARTTFVNGTLTITKAPLTIKAGNYTKKQGEDNPTFTPTYEGFKNDETEAVLTKKPTLTTTATKDSPVGTYPITASGAEAKNYEINYEAGTLTVNESGGGGTGGDTPDNPEPLPVGSTFTEDNGVIYKVTEGNSISITDARNFEGDFVIPEKVKHNGVEYTVTAIGNMAFYKRGITENTGLTSITIPSTVETIGELAFQNCTALTSIFIPEGVMTIGYQAFLGCTNLSAVSIPSTVTDIGANAFYKCTGLNTVSISDMAAWCGISFPSYDSSPLYYAKHLYLNGEEVKELIIPQGVTALGNYTFNNCMSLNSVTLPSSISSIGKYAFGNCENITQLISYIKTPSDLENETPAFPYIIQQKAYLIIPVGSKSKYEAAIGWKSFQKVVEISAFDINHDYYINKTDVNNLVNDIMGKRPANYDITQDDITGDKKVDVRDVAKMVRIIKNRYPNTEAYLGYDPEADGGDIDDPCVDCGVDDEI